MIVCLLIGISALIGQVVLPSLVSLPGALLLGRNSCYCIGFRLVCVVSNQIACCNESTENTSEGQS